MHGSQRSGNPEKPGIAMGPGIVCLCRGKPGIVMGLFFDIVFNCL